MRILPLLVAIGLALPAWADTVRLQDNAPERHVVVKGDTLWDISEKFLKDPWKWPEVWQLNRDEIKNPHLIYPGDVVRLIMVDGKPRLTLEKDGFRETVKLSPQVRAEPIVITEKAIPAIDPKAIAPFMGLGVMINKEAFDATPKLLGAVDERILIMPGDRVYASPGDPTTKAWQVFRPNKELVDPDSKEVLGFEAISVGSARTVVPGDPQTVVIGRAQMEVVIGDRIMPDNPVELESLVPHAPVSEVKGKIISAFGAINTTSQYATVLINRGKREGLEPGHVLAIHRQGRELPKEKKETYLYSDTKCVKPGKTLTNDFYDPKEMLVECSELPKDAPQQAWRYIDVGCLKPGARVTADEFFNPKEVYQLHCRPDETPATRLPDSHVGQLFLYRVYDKVSYGLIMKANGPVYLMDTVRNP